MISLSLSLFCFFCFLFFSCGYYGFLCPYLTLLNGQYLQSGRFGKLNKRVTFPETLDLSPYMSDDGDGTDVYTLYAVVVHVDMLNASFFGHYICYTKGLCGNWYKLDDCKVGSLSSDCLS